MTVRHLQRLSSLAIRYSRAMVALRPFSNQFAKNTGGPDMQPNAVRHLSRPAYADLLAWRRALELAVADPSRLTVRATWLALAAASPPNQAACADVRIWVDSQGTGGIGVFAPGIAWDGATLPHTHYFLSGGRKAPISNNVFEFFAILAGLAIAARTRKHAHVHVFTDNTSALAWATDCRGESGFHTLLIRVLCDLQIATGTLLTVGHVPGVDNVAADAISRGFNVPNGPQLLEQVTASAPRTELISQLWESFSGVLNTPSPTPLETDRAVRTALAYVTGTSSAPPT